MTSFAFDLALEAIAAGFDWTTADVRLLLIDAAADWTPDTDLAVLADLPGDAELDTDGYARQNVTGRALAFRSDTTPRRVDWQADNVVFADLGPDEGPGPEVAGAIVYVHETDDSDSWPLFWLADVTGETTGADFTVAVDPDTGIARTRPPTS